MSVESELKLARGLRLQSFLDDIPTHPHPQCQGIIAIISYVLHFLPEAIDPPSVDRTYDGNCRLSWLLKDAYLSVTVKKDGQYAWFYRDNEWHDNGCLNSMEETDTWTSDDLKLLTECFEKLIKKY